jgi:hypothetical protein
MVQLRAAKYLHLPGHWLELHLLQLTLVHGKIVQQGQRVSLGLSQLLSTSQLRSNLEPSTVPRLPATTAEI